MLVGLYRRTNKRLRSHLAGDADTLTSPYVGEELFTGHDLENIAVPAGAGQEATETSRAGLDRVRRFSNITGHPLARSDPRDVAWPAKALHIRSLEDS